MRVLLTGATGMVGRNIAEMLGTTGIQLFQPSHQDLDLLHEVAVLDYLRHKPPDAIIHAAGLVGGIQANIQHPVEFLRVNASMGMNIIGAAFSAGVPNFLNLASSCIYPKHAPNPLQEASILDGPLEPTNEGYALAKIATLRLGQYVRRERPDFQYKSVIPCNLYGRYDHFDSERGHMIAAVIRRMHEQKARGERSMTIWGDGKARREFMFAEDLAQFVVNHIEQLSGLPDVMNVGVGEDFSIDEYYHSIAEVVGFEGRFEHDLSKPRGMDQKLLDVTLQKQLGWTPSVDLKEGLTRTYEHFLRTAI